MIGGPDRSMIASNGPKIRRPTPCKQEGRSRSDDVVTRARAPLLDRPGVARGEELLEVDLALRRLRLPDDLPGDLVRRRLAHVAEDSDRRREAGLLREVREHEGDGRILA